MSLIRISALDVNRWKARDQLDLLLAVARPEDWFLIYWFHARWQILVEAWTNYGQAVLHGEEPDHFPSQPQWSWADCQVIDTLYRTNQH